MKETLVQFARCDSTSLKHFDEGNQQRTEIDSLYVVLSKTNEGWFAQGIQIDHFAEGTTEDEVMDNFASTLAKTIDLHIGTYSSIDRLLVTAPDDIRAALKDSPHTMSLSGVWKTERALKPKAQTSEQETVKRLVDSVFDKIPSLNFYKKSSSAPAAALA
jgi:hypothetical protein